MKYLKDMGYKELLALINENDELREALWEMAFETANFWVNEYLHGLSRGADYYVDPYGYTHFTITRSGDYLVDFDEWIHTAQEMYCLLSDEDFKVVETFLHYADIYEHLQHVWCKDEDFDKVERLMETYRDKSEEAIVNRIESEYSFKDVDLVDYIDDWMANNAFEEAYAKCGHIYIHCPQIVIEAHEERIA